MSLTASTIDTPVGPFTAIAENDVLVSAGFRATPAEQREQLDPRRRSMPMTVVDDLGPITTALRGYFAGDVTALDTIEVDQPGGAFRTAAWKAMRAVPPGETITYGELAALAGTPGAGQAAGTACSQNRIALVVPCHRIVRTGGGLGGYFYGLDMKRRLLAHERGEGELA
ncbi:MAG: methylated-DNA--[protein]-cysteine S-methyltransferase [Pseudonocardiales bacterium]|nr:MAG: methylated-DNA--[protein]-cysteine S-methyltransferase [Pseudonocardiales bacterium]